MVLYPSTTTLFGSDRTPGFASLALAAERGTGQYMIMLALLQLVRALFLKAAVSILLENAKPPAAREGSPDPRHALRYVTSTRCVDFFLLLDLEGRLKLCGRTLSGRLRLFWYLPFTRYAFPLSCGDSLLTSWVVFDITYLHTARLTTWKPCQCARNSSMFEFSTHNHELVITNGPALAPKSPSPLKPETNAP